MVSRKEAIALGHKTYQGSKTCKTCGSNEKYVSSSSCAPCSKAKGIEKLNNRELMQPYRTKEKQSKNLKRWRRNNKDKVQLQNERRKPKAKEYYENNKHVWRKSLLKRYGLTIEEYDKMMEEQGGKCFICEGKNKNGKRLAVDHCHDTGKVRRLLCTRCNTGIGLLQSEELLRQAIEYLKEQS